MKEFCKRLTGFTAAVLLIAVMGCSKGGVSSGVTADGKLDTSKRVELVLYVIGVEPPKQAEIYDNFNKLALERLNCTLKINWIGWGEFSSKYPLLFSSGEAFDMAYGATWLNFASLAQKGAFKNLDELFPQFAPHNYALQSKTALAQATIDGHVYAIPTLLPTYSAYGPIYRADLALPFGWDGKMENFADMERFLEIVKKNNPGIEPYDVYSMGSEMDDLFMYSNAVYPIKGSTGDFLFIDPKEAHPKLFTYWEYPKTPEFLALMERWNKAGYFPRSGLADTDSEKFRNGKSAVRLHNIDTWEGYYRDRPDWDFRYQNFVSDVSYLSFVQDALVIPNTAKNPERALALYDLITTDEEMFRAFFYGIAGKSYEIMDVDGQEQVRAMNNPDMYEFSYLWAARTKQFSLPTVGAPPNLQELKASFDAAIQEGVGAQKFRSLTIDTSSVETEYAACLSVHQQYWWPLELAYVDVVKGLEEYRDKMKAAGIERVREVFQKQLDAYLAQLP